MGEGGPPRKRGTHPLGPPARWAESDFPRVSNTASPHHIWYSSNWNGLLYIIPALCQHTKLSHVHMSDCLVSEQRMNKQCYLWPSGDRFHSKRCRWENGRMVGFSWKTSPSDWTKRLLQGILLTLIPATRFHNSITEWSAWNLCHSLKSKDVSFWVVYTLCTQCTEASPADNIWISQLFNLLKQVKVINPVSRWLRILRLPMHEQWRSTSAT